MERDGSAIFSSDAVSTTVFPGMSLSGISSNGISEHRLYISIDDLPASDPCSN
jgi:hypothetical protein